MYDFACYVISVESLVPDAPGRMEAGHVPVILHGCRAEVAKLTV
jgi:hypothetical protein